MTTLRLPVTHVDVEIANTIKDQIGVWNLVACGAHDLRAIEYGLQFKVGGIQKWITVKLNGWDTYDVELINATAKVLNSANGIYCDQIGEVVCTIGDVA